MGIAALVLLVTSVATFVLSGGGNSAAEVSSPLRSVSGWTCILGTLLLLGASVAGFVEWLRSRRR
jgi:hypothetical protein